MEKILCVGSGWFPTAPGGLERYTYDLIHQLAAGQDQVEFCGVGLPDRADSPIKLTNLARSNDTLIRRLWSANTQFSDRYFTQPDAINLHFALYSFPLLNQFPQDVPVTFTFHGPWALESRWENANWLSIKLKHELENRVYQQCDRFIVLSRSFGSILQQTYKIPEHKIHQIPGGVDTVRFQPNLTRETARKQLGWATDRLILFTPRRLVHRMGVDKLLTALAAIKSRIPDVWLAIAGRGALLATLQQQAVELELTHHVKFLGFLPEEQLPIAYQAADLTFVPSQSLEGFGLILVESLASGTPALCTPIGGMPEILEPFSPELITSSTNAAAIAERLEACLTGTLPLPSRRACRQYALAHFDWRSIGQQVRDVLL